MTMNREQELERLIRDEWPKLRRFFHTKVPEGDVLDLVQATMLAFVEGRARATAGLRPYLWGIARLQVLKHYEKHRGSTPFDSQVHTALDTGPSLSTRIDSRSRLLRALHQLPADHQMAFELRHGEELSLEEVAAALDVSLATAKRYLAAAEEKLRAILGAEADQAAAEYTNL
jgi:RNA polymerase sigma-70 factor (ECF subfamily)